MKIYTFIMNCYIICIEAQPYVLYVYYQNVEACGSCRVYSFSSEFVHGDDRNIRLFVYRVAHALSRVGRSAKPVLGR